jgi:hypothetical protein
VLSRTRFEGFAKRRNLLPQIATFPHYFPNFGARFYLALPAPSWLYYFPLRTTFRHILNALQILSREIVRFSKYFLENEWCAAILISRRAPTRGFVVGHDTSLHCFRFFFVAYFSGR